MLMLYSSLGSSTTTLSEIAPKFGQFLTARAMTKQKSPPPTSIEAVYEANAAKLYKFFYYKVLNTQIAEDLTSETFLAFAQKAHEVLSSQSMAERYLYGIARNKWNGYLRTKYANAEVPSDDIELFSALVEAEVDEMDQTESLHDRAMQFIQLLPKKQAKIAELRLIDGLTPTQIAHELAIPVNTVKVTLRRALRRLEELIATTPVSQTGKEASHE